MNITREQRRQLERDNERWPRTLARVPHDDWPARTPPGIAEVWRSRDFLVQVYQPQSGAERLTVCRTAHDGDRWHDSIAWDDLQRLKAECGRGARWAVEIYPADSEVVNVANMRHLWVVADAPAFAWRKQPLQRRS